MILNIVNFVSEICCCSKLYRLILFSFFIYSVSKSILIHNFFDIMRVFLFSVS